MPPGAIRARSSSGKAPLAARRPHAPPELLSETRKLHVLRDLTFFHGFRDVQIRETLHFARWQRFGKSDVIIEDGKRGDSFYLLVDGRVYARRASNCASTPETTRLANSLH